MKDTEKENLQMFKKKRAELRKALAEMSLRVVAIPNSAGKKMAKLEAAIAAVGKVIAALEARKQSES